MANHTTVSIVCRTFGAPSQVWVQRQISGFRRARPKIVTWRCMDARLGDRLSIHVVQPGARRPGAWRRWRDRIRNLPHGNFLAAAGPERDALRNVLSRLKPAVILAHFGHCALRVLPVAKELGIPLVAHFHGFDVSSALRNRWYRWSLLRCLREFAAVVVVGSHQREWMLRNDLPDRRVNLIPCGVPTQQFTPASEPPDGPIRFIAVSRLVAWKGMAQSIDAFATVRREIPDANLAIIGDGPEEESLRRQVRSLGLDDAVQFLSVQSPQRVAEELRRSHVFVQHSLRLAGNWEGFGVTIAEASSTGLPVVVTRCGGIVDQVVDGETGFLVDEHDVDSMADRMLRLARDADLRQRMGRAGRQRMFGHFDTAGQIRKLEDVLLEAAQQG